MKQNLKKKNIFSIINSKNVLLVYDFSNIPSFLIASSGSHLISNLMPFFFPKPFLLLVDFVSSVNRLFGFMTRLECALRFGN